jgi:outer membrane protein assembly factor BamB
MMNRCFHAPLASLIILVTSLVRAEDWPEFRGPTGQGHSTAKNVPIEWGKDKNKVWQQETPGLGWSSPVVVNGRVYLTTAVSAKGDFSLEALCLDAKTGAVLWEKQVFRENGKTAPAIHSKNSHASPTPLVQGDRLYVHFGHMGTACLDLSGKIIWRNNDLRYNPVHGNGGTPILVEDKLIFSCDGGDQAFVVALNRASGKQVWRTDRHNDPPKKFSFSTPLLITVNDKKQVISPGSEAVMAYDPATGREIWRVRYRGYSVIPRPAFAHGLLFISTSYDSPTLLAIRPDGTGDVTKTHIAWSMRQNAPHTPSVLVVGDELYMVSDDGIASRLDAKTGKIHWQERLGGEFSASPVYAAGRIYFQTEDGVGIVVKAGKQFEVLARNPLEERSLASYAVADDALFIRTAKRLYCFQSR